jgi:hypothetical protein
MKYMHIHVHFVLCHLPIFRRGGPFFIINFFFIRLNFVIFVLYISFNIHFEPTVAGLSLVNTHVKFHAMKFESMFISQNSSMWK